MPLQPYLNGTAFMNTLKTNYRMNNPPRKGGLKKINAGEAKVSPTGGDLEGG
jgi:hypothetical protein